MYFDRFDIVQAYYAFYMDYHEGQWSDKYARLCRISRYYTPGHGWNGKPDNENAQEIYDNLVAKEERRRWHGTN